MPLPSMAASSSAAADFGSDKDSSPPATSAAAAAAASDATIAASNAALASSVELAVLLLLLSLLSPSRIRFDLRVGGIVIDVIIDSHSVEDCNNDSLSLSFSLCQTGGGREDERRYGI